MTSHRFQSRGARSCSTVTRRMAGRMHASTTGIYRS